MGLESEETHRDVLRAAALAVQLPHDSRTVVAMAPAAQNGTVEHLLRRVEHNQRMWHWAHTKSARSGANGPEQLALPGEAEQHEMEVERNERNALLVADSFGLLGP